MSEAALADAGAPAFDPYAIAESWAFGIVGPARVPELYRFLSQVFDAGHSDLRETIGAADYLNETSFEPKLPRPVVADAVQRAFLDWSAGQPQTFPILGVAAPADVPPGAGGFQRPCIRFRPEHMSEHTDAAEAAILADVERGPVMAHAGCYATVRRAKGATPRQMAEGIGSAQIFHFSKRDSLRERVMASADFQNFQQKAWQSSKAPDELMNTLFARGGGNAPALTGLSPTPTVLPDGTMIDAPGYDRRTGLYCTFEPGEFPAVRSYLIRDEPPAAASAEEQAAASRRYAIEREAAETDARAAFDWLAREMFGEFCFREHVDLSAAIAALLTGLVRPVCGIAPGFIFSSPTQGTGKTTAANIIGQAITGAAPGVETWPKDDEEVEKILHGVLKKGHSVLVFDNLPLGKRVSSASLAKLLSTETHQGRDLQTSNITTLSASILVLLTGNNVILEGDLPSRVVECYLDTELERPDQRIFRRDVSAWVRANRGAVVAKALTIIKAYLDAGAPTVAATGTRFPTWDRMVRQAIIWAGGDDIAAKFDRAHEDDPGLVPLRTIIRLWPTVLGSEPLTVGAIWDRLDKVEGLSADAGDMWAAVRELAGDRLGARITKQALGQWLRRFANRPIGGGRIVGSLDRHLKQQVWAVVPTAEAAE